MSIKNIKKGNKTIVDFNYGTTKEIKSVSLNNKEIWNYLPQYVITEAQRVVANANSHGVTNPFRFIAITDSHDISFDKNIISTTTGKDIVKPIALGNRHAGQGINAIKGLINLDFVSFLGDATMCGGLVTYDNISKLTDDLTYFNKQISDGFSNIINFRLVGNHDQAGINGTRLQNVGAFPYFGVYCPPTSGTTSYRDEPGGWGYYDFTTKKVRVIYLNTSDSIDYTADGTRLNFTSTQKTWLSNTLSDVNSKSDASSWKVLILSHAPLDLINVQDAIIPYATNNGAKILANVHGHVHSYRYGYINNKIRRFGIPNACFMDNNHYYGRSGYEEYYDETTTSKVMNTAQDTSFALVTIDLDTNMCYVDNYGAGVDREFSLDYYDSGEGEEITPTTNMFDATDEDVQIGHRIRSNYTTANYAAGQLVTGYIPVNGRDKITLVTDVANGENTYTGMIALYNSAKTGLAQAGHAMSGWTWSEDKKTGVYAISTANVEYVRLCCAYSDIANIAVYEDYMNLADPTSKYWKTNYVINAQGGYTAVNGCVVTNYIPVNPNGGDFTITLKGLNCAEPMNTLSLYPRYFLTNSSYGTLADGRTDTTSSFLISCTFENDTTTVVIHGSSRVQYFRVVGNIVSGYDENSILIRTSANV